MDLRFAIAQVEVGVRFATDDIRVDQCLQPFRLPCAPGVEAHLHLDFAAEPTVVPEGKWVPPANPSHIRAQRVSDRLLLRRPTSHMVANNTFTSCGVWAEDNAQLSIKAFDGRPWLMLGLWGFLTHHHGALLHGAVCVLDGRYIMILGDQLVGKSTLAQLIVQADGTCLTDEYPVLTWTEARAWAHGTPWPGVAGLQVSLSGLLHAIFFVRHAPTNVLTQLSPREGGQLLLGNTRFFVWAPTTIPGTVEILDNTARSVPIYELGFVPELSAVATLQEAL